MTVIAMECRCCGNVLTFAAEQQLLCCPACGTQNLLPQEQVRTRPDFRNARELQRRDEFCDAEASYQRVLDDVPGDADALWGRLMCHYGAKLLTGEGTQRRYAIRIPRSKPLRAQGDFERACENAPEALRAQYEQDAAYIDRAMERIRQLAETKPPYDLFICHKTTPLEGKGYTEDYGRARDLRDMLVQRGYRVFFAPMDMEGVVAGEDYEAAIYHALNTARVMLVVCSDPALLMSTWVQSEWQRFLALCDEGKDVTLIPLLYGGMKAGSLPRAFQVRNLQAIRMELDGKDTLLERLQSLMPEEKTAPTAAGKPEKRRHPVRTTLLTLLCLAALAAGGSYAWARQNGLGWSDGWLGKLLPASTDAPRADVPVTALPEETVTPVLTAMPAPTATPTPAPTATSVPTATLTPTAMTVSLPGISVGQYVTFGHYEQDNNTANGTEPIEWLVLVVDGDKALLISRYALDCQPYNETYTRVTWETCTLRTWLNKDFLNAAFTKSEQTGILTTTVTADKNPYFSTKPGQATQDKVFLLSVVEAEKYFTSDFARQCKVTEYAVARNAYVTNEGYCWWCLRSPGGNLGDVAFVNTRGSLGGTFGNVEVVHSDDNAVRPAVWVNLSSGIF